ncbi:MAG: LuxR C-terminal-related transcriptional regulator [Prevotellaceae bacterium]|jgi:DNA-binding NarL/FixJ family response regulator|nr:LuxR C-terminal-related transcriptional regulator [Prevotellaceae bacterium]
MRTNDENVRVAVAEESAIVRSGMIIILKRLSHSKIIPMEVVSMETLIDCLQMQDIDILIANPDFSKLNIPSIKKIAPDIKLIALLTSVAKYEQLLVFDAQLSIVDDVQTISNVIEQMNIDSKKTHKNASESAEEPLSLREKEIVMYVVKGMTNKEIAENLFLSVHTVITHRRNIARKLQIHSSAALAIYAIVNNLVDIKDVKQR